ncbi:TetR/AcrR family transcriptional regulator [Sporichthya polymorpha]|uniref:TetR/AcrR family transcriptional regulator n=1 Tax=Sporichthya polymorpha TaxID=35751 RepID=UPI00036A88C7|nr:TetR/AcrR family transcriptional regulator [Sporichthya polymorpha]
MRPQPAWLLSSARALAEVFVRKGFGATRMDDLVMASGVPRATLYYHFRGKEAVLGWLMHSTAGNLASAVAEATRGPGSSRDRLEGVIRAMLATVAEYPEACRVLIGNLEQAGQLTDTVAELVPAFHLPVMALLEEGVADGSLRELSDPAATASAIFGAVAIAALQALVVEGELPTQVLGDSVVEVLLGGLEARR